MKTLKKFYYKIIDKSVSILIKLSRNDYFNIVPQEKAKPIFLMGMFRSGTSLTSQILKHLGLYFGNEYRLLKSMGRLAELNPNGFFEDFLFAQLSRFLYAKLNATGDNPPSPNVVNEMRLEKINLSEFIRFSYFQNKEDRISKFNQFIALFIFRIFKFKYLISRRRVHAIKVPMLVPFYELLIRIFPHAKFLIIIRNPESTIKSSKSLTEKSNEKLYNMYYEYLYDLYKKYPDRSIVFSYDNLLLQSEQSVKSLAEQYNLYFSNNILNLIEKKYIRNQTLHVKKNKYYDFLQSHAINK